jgi:enoyl-CoA hydratase/carnithine racemase
MTPDEVQYAVAGHTATIAINRPERRNALNQEVLREIVKHVHEAERDGAVRVIVVTGTGAKVFSAGGDLGAIQGGGFLAMHEGRGYFADAIREIMRAEKPTIARLAGHALGGGFGLALACDLVVAADDVDVGTPEIDIGLFPMMIMPLIFRHAVSRKRALEMILTGERLKAPDALAQGFLTRVVPRAELDAAVAGLAARLAAKSPAVLRLGRAAFRAMSEMPFDGALEYLKGMLTLNALTEDAAEGVAAFLEKRPPVWKGL